MSSKLTSDVSIKDQYVDKTVAWGCSWGYEFIPSPFWCNAIALLILPVRYACTSSNSSNTGVACGVRWCQYWNHNCKPWHIPCANQLLCSVVNLLFNTWGFCKVRLWGKEDEDVVTEDEEHSQIHIISTEIHASDVPEATPHQNARVEDGYDHHHLRRWLQHLPPHVNVVHDKLVP